MSCSVSELIALTRRARIFIGGDTGPLHLAAALRVPVVAIFGPTDPARNGPYGTRSIVLRSAESVTSHARRAEPDEGLLAIGSDEVLAAARELLSVRQASGAVPDGTGFCPSSLSPHLRAGLMNAVASRLFARQDQARVPADASIAWLSGHKSRGGFACRWGFCLPCFISGWRGLPGGRWRWGRSWWCRGC